MQFKDEIAIAASAAKIFSFYADVNNWSAWDPDVRSAELHGDFVAGATATIQPTKGPQSNITFVEVATNKSFVAECRLPLCTMRFEHDLFGSVHGIKVVHAVKFKGLLAPLFGLIIGTGIKKSLPNSLQGLREAVEQHDSGK